MGRGDRSHLKSPTLEEERYKFLNIQRALDWCMEYYPFADGIDQPLEIKEELRLSIERNTVKLKPGFRR
jgi:hypothetical protein